MTQDFSNILVVGLQRSGTNFATYNCFPGSLDYLDNYWKHDFKRDGEIPCDKILCIIKNPYTWIESVCFRNKVDIIEYFPEYRLYDEIDHIGPFKINLIRILNLYKNYYKSWMGYRKTELVHYEQQLLSEYPDKINSVVPHNEDWNIMRTKSYRKFSTSLLSEGEINTITETLGESFIRKIGYPIKK